MSDPVRELTEALSRLSDGVLVVVTGAGVSLASGIPTFRGNDPDAVWEHDLTELASNRYFLEDPAGSWRWYTSRFDRVLKCEPNAAHRALAELERWQLARGQFLLVTQNVDPLHERAGSRELVKVHGSADRVRCSRAGCEHAAPSGSLPREQIDIAAFQESPSRETVPTCPACGDLLRQHVLWFDEFYTEHEDYQWPRVLDAASRMDLCLFVGTSFSVGVTTLFVETGMSHGVPMFSIDPGADSPPDSPVVALRCRSEELLPEVVRDLSKRTSSRKNRRDGP